MYLHIVLSSIRLLVFASCAKLVMILKMALAFLLSLVLLELGDPWKEEDNVFLYLQCVWTLMIEQAIVCLAPLVVTPFRMANASR